MLNNDYKYAGMPITRIVAEPLILELYSDVKSYVRREDIVRDVLETHLKRGGLEATTSTKDFSGRVIGKALSNLQKKGLALNRDKSVGYWIFCEDFEPDMPYSGMTLTPTLAKEMILELFKGKTTQRFKIIETLTRVHAERGGETTNPHTIKNAIKSSSKTLKKEGLLETSVIGKGVWTVHLDPVSPQPSEVGKHPTPTESDEPDPKLKKAFKEAIGNAVLDIGKTIGNGGGYVYVYYYPLCREYAELHNKSVWACKVGETTNSPVDRVHSQLNESTFQYPVIGLTIRTNNRLTLEDSIHNILKLHGKELKSAHGKEWFMTSPSEVDRIYKGIMKI